GPDVELDEVRHLGMERHPRLELVDFHGDLVDLERGDVQKHVRLRAVPTLDRAVRTRPLRRLLLGSRFDLLARPRLDLRLRSRPLIFRRTFLEPRFVPGSSPLPGKASRHLFLRRADEPSALPTLLSHAPT